MAKDGKHVIHAGGIFPNPTLNREGAASANILPGTIGSFVAGKFTPSAEGKDSAILYVANIDYLKCGGVDNAIEQDEIVVGIHPIQGMYLNLRAAAGSYKKGDPLAIATGQVKTGGDATAKFYAEETATVVAGDLLRVVVK